MRLLYIINTFSWGGAEKLVYDLALSIRSEVEAVSVVALYKQGNETERKMIQDLNSHHIDTLILEKPVGKGRIKCIKDLLRYTKSQEISIIHSHCSVPMLFGKIIGKMTKKPVICTIHNTRGYSKNKEITTLCMVSKYISIGQSVEDYMTKTLKIPPRKIERIYNAIDTTVFVPKERNPVFWNKYPGQKDELKILNVARVNEQKNQMCLLRATKKCLDNHCKVHVYILGSYDEYDITYRKMIDFILENGLSDYVTFLGVTNNVNEFLQNSDCFVMTSWYEGLSVAFLEAVSCGIPIITTDMPFVNELLSFGKCATVIPQDDDITLTKLLINRLYFKPDNSVIKTFQNQFSLSFFCKQHLALYRSFTKNDQS